MTGRSALTPWFVLLVVDVGIAEVRFDFDGVPAEIRGTAGAKREFVVFATLTAGPGEAEASWTLSMTADGARIVDVAVDGLFVTTDQGELPVFENNFFSVHAPERDRTVEVFHEDDPDRAGAFSVISHLNYPASLPEFLPDSVHRLARITVEVVLPPVGVTREVTIRYEDGFLTSRFAGGEGVDNGYLFHGLQQAPDVVVPRTILVTSEEPTFRRADTNADGDWDVSDVIFALGYLFLGGATPGCESSVDANDDGKIDISDPSYLILFLFYGGERPPDPFANCGSDFPPDGLTCESFPPCL